MDLNVQGDQKIWALVLLRGLAKESWKDSPNVFDDVSTMAGLPPTQLRELTAEKASALLTTLQKH